MRLKVAQDVARGLTYLHEDMFFQIIFRDFKSSNILLDENWRPTFNLWVVYLGQSMEGKTRAHMDL
ncbi:putative protein kinase RLK-Pelle-RLCK-VIIa-2 family [Helianthus anomalus]